MKNNKFIITTSWDDGSIHDRKLVSLLKKYSIKGTFYISKEFDYAPKGDEKVEKVSDDEMKTLYQGFEVGAHSITHTYFNDLSDEQIKEEVLDSKKYLEELLGHDMKVFCYPGGRYNNTAIDAVKNYGFLGARTTELFRFDVKDNFLMPTTINCYPFPFGVGSAKVKASRFLKNIRLAYRLNFPIRAFFGWKNLAKFLFDKTEKEGGVFHLWGQSWEIEKNGMWEDLEEVLKYIANKGNAEYMTNAEVLIREFKLK